MAINLCTMQAHLEAARAALAAADYDTAETEAMAAQACLAGIPDGQSGDAEMSFRDNDIPALIKTIREARMRASLTSAGGIQRTKIAYVRPTS